MSGLIIRPLNTGYVGGSPRQYLYHYSAIPYRRDVLESRVENPVFAFLVQGGSSLLLVDTGMSSTIHAQAYHFQTARQPQGMAIHERLDALGLRPEDIDLVILTHLHWDHSFYLEQFTKATVYVHEKEWAFAQDPLPLYYKAYEHHTIGLRRPFEQVCFHAFSGEKQIMPGVTVFETPGHSPGHISVAVKTESGEYICAGDSLLSPENLNPIPALHYNISPPGIFCNILEAWKSIEIQKARIKNPSFILCCHDPNLEKRIRQMPILM